MTLTSILDNLGFEAVEISLPYQEKTPQGVSLKGVLQQGSLKVMRTKSPWRAGKTFRPSGITYSYCRRLKVAQLAGLVEIYDEPKKPKEQLRLDIGSAIHDIIQNRFWDIGILKGSFKCIKCGKIYHDQVSPTICPSGMASHTRECLSYKEVIYKNAEYQISGRSDGIIVVPPEELMDIKSIQNRLPSMTERQFCFEDLETKGPKFDHVVQLMLYEWMSEIHMGHLMYVSMNSPTIKTFAIPFDYKVIEPYLVEIKNLIAAAELLKAGKRPEMPITCGRADCPCEQF